MRKIKIKTVLAAVILTATNVVATPVFAANPYGIDYAGGQELGAETVTIDPTFLNELTPLIDMGKGDVEVTFSNSTAWKDGYSANSFCTKMKYIAVDGTTDLSELNDLYYIVKNRQYQIRVDLKSIIQDNMNFPNDKWTPVGILMDNSATEKGTPKGSIEVGFGVYSDEECTVPAENNANIIQSSGKLFIETKQRLYATTAPNTIFNSDILYYGIMDIDGAQAFKILNRGNELTKSTMIARSAAALQPEENELKNMYVEDGYYIYAQVSNIGEGAGIAEGSDIFVKLSRTTQNDGLDLVYGFAAVAGSPISYYAKQYTVKYVSDKNGKIKDVESEKIIAGKNPFGSTTTPEKGYVLDYWTANKDVTLEDETVIKAGAPITPDQIKKIIVNEDLTFTAVHAVEEVEEEEKEEEEEILVPDTGASTSEKNAEFVAISIVGAVLGTSIIGVLVKIICKAYRKSQFYNN